MRNITTSICTEISGLFQIKDLFCFIYYIVYEFHCHREQKTLYTHFFHRSFPLTVPFVKLLRLTYMHLFFSSYVTFSRKLSIVTRKRYYLLDYQDSEETKVFFYFVSALFHIFVIFIISINCE